MKAEDDSVDPLEILRDKCKEQEEITNLRDVLNRCNDRVHSKKKTMETCVEELMDFVEAVDKCVSKQLFDHLK